MRLSFVGHTIASVLFVSTFAIWFVIELRQGLNRRTEAKDTDHGSLYVHPLHLRHQSSRPE